MAEIKEVIKPCWYLVASSHPSDHLKPFAICILSRLLIHACEFTNNIEYINKVILIPWKALNLSYREQGGVFPLLIGSLLIHFELHCSREDLDEIMQVFQMVVDHRAIYLPEWFQGSCAWALFAWSLGHPSTATTYHYTLSLLQDSLTFTPTVDIQHSWLVLMHYNCKMLPLDCKSYQVQTGQLQRAVETLEWGRALIWSEMHGLHSLINQLCTSDPNLADKFAVINEDLEALTLTFLQNNYGDSGEEGLKGMHPFGHLIIWQHVVWDDHNKLISQIWAWKGMESFLKPLSIDNLCSAAVHRPMVIINHYRWCSDIIILLCDSPPSLIPTANNFYDWVNKLCNQLLGAREKGLSSPKYDDALCFVLEELYELIGHPEIQRLNKSDV